MSILSEPAAIATRHVEALKPLYLRYRMKPAREIVQAERDRCIRILEARKQGRGASFADIIDSLIKEVRDQEPDEVCL